MTAIPDLSAPLARLIAVMLACEPFSVDPTTDEEWDAALIEAQATLQAYHDACGPEILLTDRQAEVLAFIASHRLRHRKSPSIREIAGAFGHSSPGAAHNVVSALIGQGVLANGPQRFQGQRRSLIITPDGYAELRRRQPPKGE